MTIDIYAPLAPAIIVTGAGEAIATLLEATPESGGVPNKMRLCYLVPGAIAADSCQCGQLALSIQMWDPSDIFPTSAADSARRAPCGPASMSYRVIASLFRCVPTVNSQGIPPTCDALRAAALVQVADQWVMRKALTDYLCGLKRRYTITDFRVGAAVPLGPEGACGGVEIAFSFQLV